MNYINFNIGGKDRGFQLGLGFLGDVLKHYNTDLVGLGDLMVQNPFSVTPTILYYGHKHNCIRRKEAIDFEMYDVEDWIDELPNTLNNENIEKLLLLMFDSVKKHLPKVDEEPSKKK